jgi:8-amino-7-oxononanoate synthase
LRISFRKEKQAIETLKKQYHLFQSAKNLLGLKPLFIRSKSAIQSAIIPGNENVKKLLNNFRKMGLISTILSPTVPQGQERLFVCLHSYNTPDQIEQV